MMDYGREEYEASKDEVPEDRITNAEAREEEIGPEHEDWNWELEDCSFCSGTGEGANPDIPCSSCKGTGVQSCE